MAHSAQKPVRRKHKRLHQEEKKLKIFFFLQYIENPPAFGFSSFCFLPSPLSSSCSKIRRFTDRKTKSEQNTFFRSPSDGAHLLHAEKSQFIKQLITEKWKIEICDRKVQSRSDVFQAAAGHNHHKSHRSSNKLVPMRRLLFSGTIWQQAEQKAANMVWQTCVWLFDACVLTNYNYKIEEFIGNTALLCTAHW